MKITIEQIKQRRQDGGRVVMLTCYDYPTAQVEDAAGVDVLLVGDSVGTNVLGYSDVNQVTLADMIHHVKAVARGAQRALVLGDMPSGTFATDALALSNARALLAAGADAVKIEGESEALSQVRTVAGAGIAVCAHIGYTPQTDGAKASVQGRDVARAIELMDIARKLESAGASMLVLELIPERLAQEITACISIPTIGIGAGRFCTGQVQVVLDIAGMSTRVYRHAKAYGSVREQLADAITAYVSEVRHGMFPTAQHAATLPDDVYEQVHRWCEEHRRGMQGGGAATP